MFTPEEFEKAYPLAYYLHPDEALAVQVVCDACDKARIIQRTEEHRPQAKGRPHKLPLAGPALPQVAVYLASAAWEQDQESLHPEMEPRYNVTREDRLVRYVKLLCWQGMTKDALHTAVALGCCLYTCPAAAIPALVPGYFSADNIRRVHSQVHTWIERRFPGCLAHRSAPSAADDALVTASLTIFTPWVPPRLLPDMLPDVLARLLPPTESPRRETAPERHAEWERRKAERELIRALIDPAVGFVRVWRASISHQAQERSMPPEDPSLSLPHFPGGSSTPPRPRTPPQPFGPREKQWVKAFLKQQQARRAQYHMGTLLLKVDGAAWGRSDGGTVSSWTIPLSASYVEVFGEDAQGELLLAVFSVETVDPDRVLSVRQANGRVECRLAPVADDPDMVTVQITWVPASVSLLGRWGRRMWVRLVRELRQLFALPAVPVLATGLLLVLGGSSWLLGSLYKQQQTARRSVEAVLATRTQEVRQLQAQLELLQLQRALPKSSVGGEQQRVPQSGRGPLFGTASPVEPQRSTGEASQPAAPLATLNVIFREDRALGEIQLFLRRLSARIVYGPSPSGVYRVEVPLATPGGLTPDEILRTLQTRSDLIRTAELVSPGGSVQ